MPEYPKDDVVHLLQPIARVIADTLPSTVTFFLLVGDLGEGEGRRLNYVSNMDRNSAIETMREFISGHAKDYGKHKL